MTLAPECRALSLFLILFHQGLAQAQAPQGRAASGKPAPAATTAQTDKDKALRAERDAKVLRLRGFADRLLSLQDVKTKSVAVARLADLLWQADEPYARQLFTTAFGISAPRSGAPASEASSLLRVRAEIISLIERRDAEFARKLADSAGQQGDANGAAERARVDFHDAFSLIESDPTRAVSLVERNAVSGVPPFMHSFLITLRLKNAPAADALFLQTLDQLVAQPGDNADMLLRLGAYVFTSSKINPNDTSVPPDRLIMVAVGDTLVVDLTADRANIPPPIVRAYLKAAADILLRQASLPARSASFYIAARVLLPHYERHAPDLAPMVTALLATLGAEVTPQLRQEASYKNLEADAVESPDEALETIGKVSDEQIRDARYLALAFDLWQRSDFVKARAAAAKIAREETRAELSLMISFREAALKLESPGGVTAAEEMAEQLPDGVERAMLRLGITRSFLKAGQKSQAATSVNSMLAAVRKVGDARRPYLLLCAASEVARFDPELAKVLLAEAVQDFNKQKAEDLDEVEWARRVEAGVLMRYFPVGVKGVVCDFRQTLPQLLESDREGTMTTVESLKGERQLAEALLTVASAVMKQEAR
jgi:hypothetical protein